MVKVLFFQGRYFLRLAEPFDFDLVSVIFITDLNGIIEDKPHPYPRVLVITITVRILGLGVVRLLVTLIRFTVACITYFCIVASYLAVYVPNNLTSLFVILCLVSFYHFVIDKTESKDG